MISEDPSRGNPQTPSRSQTPIVLQNQTLLDAGFFHGFSTRQGGKSPPDDALNFGTVSEGASAQTHNAHTKEHLLENERRLAAAVGFSTNALYQVEQVHGSKVVIATGAPATFRGEKADAILGLPNAHGPRIAVGVRTADCVPILLADPESGAVAAIHAGWRGIVLGVVSASGGAMPPSNRANWIAAIGPCIERCCFEVEESVAVQLERACHADVRAASRGERVLVDLRAAARLQLRQVGLLSEQIFDIHGCTHCDSATFFSFRRDGASSGRHLSVICAGQKPE